MWKMPRSHDRQKYVFLHIILASLLMQATPVFHKAKSNQLYEKHSTTTLFFFFFNIVNLKKSDNTCFEFYLNCCLNNGLRQFLWKMRSCVTCIYFKTSGTWMRFCWLHIQEQQIDSGCGSDKHLTEYDCGKPVHDVASNNIQPPWLCSATLFTQY